MMMIRLLLLAVLGLSFVLFITLQKNSALRYEVGFLTTHYELLTSNNDELKKIHVDALVQARVLQIRINRLLTEKKADEIIIKPVAKPGAHLELISNGQLHGKLESSST